MHEGRYWLKDRSDGLVAVQDARVEAFGGRAVARGDAAAPKTARSGHHRGRVKLLVAKRRQGGVKVPERQPGLLRGVNDVKEPAVNVLGGTNVVEYCRNVGVVENSGHCAAAVVVKAQVKRHLDADRAVAGVLNLPLDHGGSNRRKHAEV